MVRWLDSWMVGRLDGGMVGWFVENAETNSASHYRTKMTEPALVFYSRLRGGDIAHFLI